MAPSPVPVLLIVTIVTVFQAVAVGDTYVDESFKPPVDEGDSFGGIDIIGDIIDAIVGVMVLVGNFMTFGAFTEAGPPFWVAVPVAVAQTGSIAWSVATLLRGN